MNSKLMLSARVKGHRAIEGYCNEVILAVFNGKQYVHHPSDIKPCSDHISAPRVFLSLPRKTLSSPQLPQQMMYIHVNVGQRFLIAFDNSHLMCVPVGICGRWTHFWAKRQSLRPSFELFLHLVLTKLAYCFFNLPLHQSRLQLLYPLSNVWRLVVEDGRPTLP